MKDQFLNLPLRTQIVFTTIPIYVSSTENPDSESEQQVIARQARFLKLPKGIRWKLASFDIGDKIELLGRKYGFELLRLANITRLIREYYFGEVRLDDFPREIEKRMGVSLLTAQEIARYIRSEIIDWDPWGEYLDKLPHLPLRQILTEYPKIADTEITSGYIELKTSEDLENPTIKNWIHDYVLHLGQAGHSQMERTRYLFHSENGQNLSSPDREKLGIILKSFDENTPLPVDEESNEIVFDGLMSEPASSADRQKSPSSSPFSKGGETASPLPFVNKEQDLPLSQRGIKGDLKNDFIKPYPAQTQPQRPTSPQPSPYQGEGARFTPAQTAPNRPQTPPMPKISYQVTSSIPEPLPRTSPHPSPSKGEGVRPLPNPEIDKFFNISEAPNIPPLKIHSITEHTESPARNDVASSGRRSAPPTPPRPNTQPPAITSPQPLPPRLPADEAGQTSSPRQMGRQAYQGEGVVRPQHRIINPFEKRFTEPKIDGNLVDLREEEK